jgi:NAD(P)-dependent dehydrogenase (short-subunit alcohol dehydrogenase family)
MMSAINMKGKGVLVTGAGTGIGREIALEFSRCGANVVFHYSHSGEGAISAVTETQSRGGRASCIQADLSGIVETEKLAEDAAAFLGRVDVLVNNAGITFNRPFLEITHEQYQKLYDVNVRAGFILAQKLAPAMIARGGGSICNLTSVHGLQGAAEHAVYAGTKGAIIAGTRALSMELAHRGVRVNAIAPGWIDVENHAKAATNYDPEAAKQAAAEKVPVGRYGIPADVARLTVFLCSDAASFIVGQTIVIDGGTTALMSLFSDFRAASKTRYGERYLS